MAITCARLPDAPAVVNTITCTEPLLVGVRSDHQLAGDHAVALDDLAQKRLAMPSDTLFPVLARALRRALDSAGVQTTVRPVIPALRIPYTLQWSPERAQTAAVARFVRLALTHDVPPGWQLEPGHLRHRDEHPARPDSLGNRRGN